MAIEHTKRQTCEEAHQSEDDGSVEITIEGKKIKIKPFYNKEDEVPQELIDLIEKSVEEMHAGKDEDESIYETDPDSAEAHDLKEEGSSDKSKD